MTRTQKFGMARAAVLSGLLGVGLVAPSAHAQTDTLTVWSHFADHQGVRDFFDVVKNTFEAENDGATLDITFFEKQSLFAAQSTALPAGEGPDILYLEPDQMQFVNSGFVRPIDDLVDLDRIEDYAKEAWTVDGSVYGLGMQAFSVELYYNGALMDQVSAQANVTLEPNFQLSQSDFLELVETSVDMGIVPIVQGIGDRPYPGAYLLQELLLRKLGREDYARLWDGVLTFDDPRVKEVFDYVETLVQARAYPKTFTTLKLGESHQYFYSKPGGLTFPLASWYSSRAFNAPDQGGQPNDFRLGIMQYPALDGAACNECKTIGVAGTYGVNASVENETLVKSFLDIMTRPEMGRMWMENTRVGTGVKIGETGGFEGEHADYFDALAARSAERTFFLGTPLDFIDGQCKEVFIQVINAAFPAGYMSADDAIEEMNAACHSG